MADFKLPYASRWTPNWVNRHPLRVQSQTYESELSGLWSVQSDDLHSHRKTELSGKIIRYILFSRVKYSNRNCGGILLAVAARTRGESDLAFLSYVCLRCCGCAFSLILMPFAVSNPSQPRKLTRLKQFITSQVKFWHMRHAACYYTVCWNRTTGERSSINRELKANSLGECTSASLSQTWKPVCSQMNAELLHWLTDPPTPLPSTLPAPNPPEYLFLLPCGLSSF